MMSERLLVLSLILLCLITESSVALTAAHNNTVGWHWYNVVEKSVEKQKKSILWQQFQRLSATQQLKILQHATNELRAKSILSGNVADITQYKRAQDMWVNKATQFTVGWEKMLLLHPDLNYALQYPSTNRLVPLSFKNLHQREKNAIEKLSHSNGLLFFYRGGNAADRLLAETLQQFVKTHHFSLVPISVDGKRSRVFLKERFDPTQAHAKALGIHYYPALILVNPHTGQHQIVSYGFKSSNALAERLLAVADHWRADF